MKVFVTGATGFTGSHTVRALLEAGHAIRLLVRDPAKVDRVFGPLSEHLRDQIVGDVTDPEAITRGLDGCEGVVHTAALVDLRKSMAQRVLDTNCRGVELVIGGACERELRHVVYVSSLGAFFTPGCSELHPEMPIAPAANAYGQSKVQSERFVRGLQEAGHPIAVTYPVGIIGPDDPGVSEANNAVLAWIGTQGVHTSSGLQILDVRDLAEMHRILLEQEPRACRYAAAGEFIPWADFASVVEGVTGVRPRYVRVSGPMMRGIGIVGDVIKRFWDFDFPITHESMQFATMWPGADATPAERELGVRFRPKEETLADTLRWMHEAGHMPRKHVGRLASD